jgi:L,D-transpeptidase YbiS
MSPLNASGEAWRYPARAPRRVLLIRLPGGASWMLWPLALVALLSIVLWSSGYRYRPLSLVPPSSTLAQPAATADKETQKLRREVRGLQAALDQRVPRGKYIVIDRTNNRLYLKQGDTILLESTCSAGSGMILKEEEGGRRTWVFDTPRGAFRVLTKVRNPVWKKPDWAFIEEGKPLPRNQSERFEYGTLGEYALYFGNGYMIHGTLYERLLGRNVTHGCIRLGRQDLRTVFQSAPIGTPIYVF